MRGYMKYAICFTAMLAGCASTTADVRMTSAEEYACAAKATQFMRERYPEAKLDERGIPYVDLVPTHYVQWATVADRCMKASGVY